MKSTTAVTYEFDNTTHAAKELLSCLEGFELQKNTVGILYADVEMDVDALAREIRNAVSFDIIGATAQAVLDCRQGMNEFASSLLVMTADDVFFDIFVSGDASAENIEAEIEQMCGEVAVEAVRDTKLVILYTPEVDNILIDDYTNNFTKYLSGVPIFGGVAGSDSGRTTARVIHNENVYINKFAAVFVSGNIAPVFSIGSKVTEDLDNYKIITKAEKNVVYEINCMTFVDYVKKLGMEIFQNDDDVNALIQGLTLNIIMPGAKSVTPPVYRAIKSVDTTDGSCTLFGSAPINGYCCVSVYDEGKIQVSTRAGVQEIKEKIEQNGGGYSVILCGSCEGRYSFMYPSKTVEGDIIKAGGFGDLTVFGCYTGGEFCPVDIVDKNGKKSTVNRAHNTTLTFCAF